MTLDDVGAPQIAIGVGLFVLSLLFTSAVMVALLLRLPADHLRLAPASRRPHTTLGWLRKIGKNLLGLVLVLFGVVLSLPGVPGQGLLTIFAGVLLLDFPGKHRLERRLMARPSLLRAVNRVRARFDRPPLLAEEILPRADPDDREAARDPDGPAPTDPAPTDPAPTDPAPTDPAR